MTLVGRSKFKRVVIIHEGLKFEGDTKMCERNQQPLREMGSKLQFVEEEDNILPILLAPDISARDKKITGQSFQILLWMFIPPQKKTFIFKIGRHFCNSPSLQLAVFVRFGLSLSDFPSKF